MASLEECWAQLFDSPWARQVAGRRVVRPTPFSRDARKWARQYLEEDGTGSPMMKDRAEIKEIVAAFLRQGNIIAKHLPPFEDSRMAKKVVQMPRDRVVIEEVLVEAFSVMYEYADSKRRSRQETLARNLENRSLQNPPVNQSTDREQQSSPRVNTGNMNKVPTSSPLSSLSEGDCTTSPLRDRSEDEEMPLHMMDSEILDGDLMNSPRSPLPDITDLENVNSASREYSSSLSENESDIPMLENKFKTIVLKPSESAKASSINAKHASNSFRAFSTLEELIDELRRWRDEHNGQQPPGTGNLSKSKSRPGDTDIRSVMIGHEPAEISRVEFDDDCFIWVLKKLVDGTRIVVKPNGSSWQGWLGGDRGFSTKVIPHLRRIKPLTEDAEQIFSDIFDSHVQVPDDLSRAFDKSWKASERKQHDKSRNCLPPGLKPHWGLKPTQLEYSAATPAKRAIATSAEPRASSSKRLVELPLKQTWHFLPADATQEAVLKSSLSSDIVDSVMSAYKSMKPPDIPEIVAIRASWDGALRPVLVSFQYEESYEESYKALMEALGSAANGQRLDVEITCLIESAHTS